MALLHNKRGRMNKQEIEKRKKILLELFSDKIYKPMKIKELAILLDIHRDKRYELEELIYELIDEGKIIINLKGKIELFANKTYTGIYSASPKGFGFIKCEEIEKDIFIPKNKNMSALNGDKVSFIIEIDDVASSKHSEGRIVAILEHANERVVGIFQKSKNFGFVIPDNQKILKDIFVSKKSDMNAKSGDKVVVSIYDFGSNKRKPEGKIIEILGNAKDVGVDILSIAKNYNLDMNFPDEVMREVKSIDTSISNEELSCRRDYRTELTVTIDGEDAKDLDDAISLSYNGEIWTLAVHIADVTHYVRENSYIDKEAIQRGTSVYLVDRVIPMLPRELSNGICSLNAGEDRLALSCIMDIDNKGKVLRHEIAETVINVDYRMTYTDVAKILNTDDEDLKNKYSPCLTLFKNMAILSKILRDKRFKRGAIDFDFPESKVILNEKGKVVDIKPYERNIATKIIEDFMLLANETVAEEYFWRELPFVYRVHENPDTDKMKALARFINNFGFILHNKGGEIYPKDLQKLLDKLEGSPKQNLISRIILRSMKKARYQTESIGHFGLATKYYTHFTSPIRRYPDLQIHRIIKENIHQRLNKKRLEHYDTILEDICFKSSTMERQAEEAERESIKYKKCEYMLSHIGEEFIGVISGMANFGFYVELENTIEGLVHIASLKNDYYNYIEDEYKIVGDITKISYSIGESVIVKVLDVDKLSKTIDFSLIKKI